MNFDEIIVLALVVCVWTFTTVRLVKFMNVTAATIIATEAANLVCASMPMFMRCTCVMKV